MSETGAPAAFPSSPGPAQMSGEDADSEVKKAIHDKPVPVHLKEVHSNATGHRVKEAPPGLLKRKRGRPPKAQTLAARKATNKTKRARVKLHRQPKAAVKEAEMKHSPEHTGIDDGEATTTGTGNAQV